MMNEVMYTKFEQEQVKLYYTQKFKTETSPKPLFEVE